MLNPRKLMFGSMPGELLTSDADKIRLKSDTLDASRLSGLVEIMESVEVVPVFARPVIEADRPDYVDHSAEIVVGDVTDEMSLGAFERTVAEYEGTSIPASSSNGTFSIDSNVYNGG